MAEKPSVLCTVCVRGGSTGIPDKNLRQVGGKPLLVHSIEDGRSWERTTDLVVSTDSDEIATVAESAGARVPFSRPARLATDTSPKLPVIRHAHEEMERRTDRIFEYVVDLDATAPLRTVADIEDCFRVVKETDAENAYTVTEADKNPYFNMVELDEDGYASPSKEMEGRFTRRQDTPTVYEMNAAVYVFQREFLMKSDTVHGDRTRISEMPAERSVDIDTPLDLAFAKFLYEREGGFQ